MQHRIRILIIGPAGSGKMEMVEKLEKEKKIKHGKITTTKPVNKKNNEFQNPRPERKWESKDETIPMTEKDGHKYWLSFYDFETKNIYIVTPQMAKEIRKKFPYPYITIYMEKSESQRYNTLLSRGMTEEEAKAQIESDRIEYNNFKEYDIRHVLTQE